MAVIGPSGTGKTTSLGAFCEGPGKVGIYSEGSLGSTMASKSDSRTLLSAVLETVEARNCTGPDEVED